MYNTLLLHPTDIYISVLVDSTLECTALLLHHRQLEILADLFDYTMSIRRHDRGLACNG
jgi:hypothetical protein